MSEQHTLPYQKHNAASRLASTAFATWSTKARPRVYEYIRLYGPCTDAEIQRWLQMNPNTERPRRIELENAGHIRPVGVSDKGPGRVLFEWTGKPYPTNPPKGYWKSNMRAVRADKPTAEEIRELVRWIKAEISWPLISTISLTTDALKTLRWLERQAK